MKKFAIALISLSFAASAFAEAVEHLDPVVPTGYSNPISPLFLCADPTAVEYNGRVYLYGSNDQQEYDANGGTGDNTYGKIKSLVVLSSEDMVNWTHHGVINMAEVCGSWLGNSWAPSIASRVEDDGLTHFYMYFANGGGGVGVVTSTSPLGPWTAPLNHTLISHGTPGLGECCWPFDPGVVIDDEGTGWLAFGGGDPISTGSDIMPGNARIVKLNPDMVSFASDIMYIPAPYHFEASELNIINGKFVYTYCTSWRQRVNADWRQYHPTAPAPSICSMCYLTTDNPLDYDSWEWGGEILKNPGNFGYPTGNNHTHMQKYDDKYYMFYHTQVMEKLAGIKGAYRSIGVNRISVDEDNVVLSETSMTDGGVSQIKEHRINPFERQEAETMWNGVGVSITSYGDAGNTVVNKMKPGSWVAVKNINFGDRKADKISVNVRGKGRIAVVAGNLKQDPLCIIDYESKVPFVDVVAELSKPLTGLQTIYFVFMEANNTARFDHWQFLDNESGAVADVEVAPAIVADEYYTLTGVKVANPESGMYIRRTLYSDGSVSAAKIAK